QENDPVIIPLAATRENRKFAWKPSQNFREHNGADRAFTIEPQASGQVAALGLRDDGIPAKRGEWAPCLHSVLGAVVDVPSSIGLLPEVPLHRAPTPV